jgi:membrane-bound lytic murein transglycosylase D
MKQNLLILLTFWVVSAGSINKNVLLSETDRGVVSKEVIDKKICRMELELDYRVDERVLSRIKRYVTYGKKDTELLLGRSYYYFPIFEHYLRVYGLPEELKYLPMVESGLQPAVKSIVGATGLWQIMDFNADKYGLKVNEYVDERQDVYKSTEAAVKLLKELYNQYGEWTLVLAAYNAGPGRVNKAIKLSNGGANFWEIEAFLPKETRMYVPSFVAASYIANYYPQHQIQPRIKPHLSGETRILIVEQPLSFKDINLVSGVSFSWLQRLNPGYLNGFIPGNQTHYLVLPLEHYQDIRDFLYGGVAVATTLPENTLETQYVVLPGDSVMSIAKRYECDPQLIITRNQLEGRPLVVNEQIVLYLNKKFAFNRA